MLRICVARLEDGFNSTFSLASCVERFFACTGSRTACCHVAGGDAQSTMPTSLTSFLPLRLSSSLPRTVRFSRAISRTTTSRGPASAMPLVYHLEVSADSEFKQLVDETWVAGTSAQVQSLDLSDLEPGTYFWRVSALDADGYESAWSHTAHFIYPMSLR